MITVFTLCSANYLAHAKTLGDSLREHNPDYQFVIGLVDRVPKEPGPSYQKPYEMIPVEELDIPEFGEMARDHTVVELNTAVKPFYIEHFYRRDPAVEAVIYLDPDILVYSSFKLIADKLGTCNIVVTPHSCTFDDSTVNVYYEKGMLTTGIYNLGFIATSRHETTFAFLKWWQKRVCHYCYYRPGSGVFVDQLWVTLAPLYFPNVYVEKDPGYNMCYWNHFERRLSRRDGSYVVNGKHDLVFYHFSSYNPTKPELIASRTKAQVMSFSERPDLKPIYDDYRSRLLGNDYASMSSLRYSLRTKPPKSNLTPKRAVKRSLRAILKALPVCLQKRVQDVAQFTADNCLPEG